MASLPKPEKAGLLCACRVEPLPALGKSRGEGILATVVGVAFGRQLRDRYSWPGGPFSVFATLVADSLGVSVLPRVLLLLCGLAGGFLRRLGLHGLLRSLLRSFLLRSHIAS